MAKENKIKHPGEVKKVTPETSIQETGTQETSAKEIASETEKTREDYEEDYKCAHIGLIAEFVRDAAGM